MADVEKPSGVQAANCDNVNISRTSENGPEKPSLTNSDTEVVEDSSDEEKKSGSIKDYFVCESMAVIGASN